jgi:hypothetical protein
MHQSIQIDHVQYAIVKVHFNRATQTMKIRAKKLGLGSNALRTRYGVELQATRDIRDLVARAAFCSKPRTGSLLLARAMTIGDAHLAPGQLWLRDSGGGPPCFSTVTGSHYVDVYDGAKSKSVWTVRNTVSVQNAHDTALRTKCDFSKVAIGRSVSEC